MQIYIQDLQLALCGHACGELALDEALQGLNCLRDLLLYLSRVEV